MKKIFSILALLLMAVSGAWAQTERLLTTITPTGNTTYSETNPGAVTVIQGCEYYKSGYGWGFDQKTGSVTVEANEGYTISKCVFTLSNGSTTTLTISTPPFKINFVWDDEIGCCYCEGTEKWYLYFYVKSIQVYTNKVDVTGINLDKTEASMTVGGDALTLTATVAPATATNKTVTWTTSDPTVATVADGVVTAVGAGTATITATATNGTAATSDDKTATCTVTVSNPTVTANEGATGEYWSTYYNATQGFTADANTTVFQAALSGSSLTLTEVPNREIPATKAVILKSSSATITLTPASTTETLEGNSLTGTTAAMTGAAGNIYVLNNGTQGVGFYKLKSTGTIGANKAYLTYSGSLAPEFFGFDGNTTSISEIEKMRNVENETFYDLQGRRVAQPTKGLYIVNGKKVVIK